MDSSNVDLLRALTSSVAQLALKELRSSEQGAILAFALCIDACLVAEADSIVFLSLMDRIGGLPAGGRVGELYQALLDVCQQASYFDAKAVELLVTRLLALRSPGCNWN